MTQGVMFSQNKNKTSFKECFYHKASTLTLLLLQGCLLLLRHHLEHRLLPTHIVPLAISQKAWLFDWPKKIDLRLMKRSGAGILFEGTGSFSELYHGMMILTHNTHHCLKKATIQPDQSKILHWSGYDFSPLST